MARYPGARWRPLKENATQVHITPTQVILHSQGDGSGSLYAFFQTGSNLESHFWIGPDGEVEQYLDTTVRADANLDANVRAISIETAGLGAVDKREWNDAQVASIVDLILWCHDTHGIPIRRCPTWSAPGIGYHVMFGSPGPWTPVAKSCPGTARIRQFPTILALAASGGSDMPITDNDAAKIATAVWARFTVKDSSDNPTTLSSTLSQILIASQTGIPGAPATDSDAAKIATAVWTRFTIKDEAGLPTTLSSTLSQILVAAQLKAPVTLTPDQVSALASELDIVPALPDVVSGT